MNKKPYTHILDAVASDHIPANLDLAPDILARIEKGKGFKMQTRIKVISAVLLAAIAFIILISSVPGVAAAIQRWFGYVPGVGLVRAGSVRVLAEPVSVTREGVTVTVDQVVADSEHTVLVYTVEGIPNTATTLQPENICQYVVSLHLPDGTQLGAGPNGLQAWGAGYQHQFNFPPLPADVSQAKLTISCLFSVKPGAAPENWEIPLRFVAAPPNLTAFPVIEIPTPTAQPATAAPSPTPPSAAQAPTDTAEAAPAVSGPAKLSLTLDRAVQMDDGYLIYATLHWQDTPFRLVDITDPLHMLRLLDASGQPMLYEPRYDEQTGPDFDKRQTVFAIKTAPVQTPGPLTLVVESMLVNLPAQASFPFDPGPNPQPGQTWSLNQAIQLGAYDLHLHSVTAGANYYDFEMTSDSGIQFVGLADLAHPAMGGGGGGGGGGQLGQIFSSTVNYDQPIPAGPLTITILGIDLLHTQRLEAQWTPPAASTNLLPTQPAACLTSSSWKAAQAQSAPLPADLAGQVLTNGQLASGEWGLVLSNLDGSNRREFSNARDGSLSPDGKKLAYSSLNAGINILDLVSGQTTPLPGTADGDLNPIWSPDGAQIVFNRGMGIFDLFITHLDGSNLRRLTQGGVQEWPVGWLPDGQLLYIVPGRENEYTIYQVNVQSGESKEFSRSEVLAISPDGKHILTGQRAFGDRWQVYLSQTDGSNRWLLGESGLWILTPLWSQDGQWLLASVSDTDAASTSGALINLRTCQVIALPGLRGSFLSWIQ